MELTGIESGKSTQMNQGIFYSVSRLVNNESFVELDVLIDMGKKLQCQLSQRYRFR